MEVQMRLVVAAVVGVFALAMVPVEAAPIVVKSAPVQVGAAPSVELVAGGCGIGFHRGRWRDRWHHWHWRCVPN
jgi:hypothetical protein